MRGVAVAHGIDPLVITCAPENPASKRTLERARATPLGPFVLTPDPPTYRDGRRRLMRSDGSPGDLRGPDEAPGPAATPATDVRPGHRPEPRDR